MKLASTTSFAVNKTWRHEITKDGED